jgi:phosphatidylethanolamine-binding protein
VPVRSGSTITGRQTLLHALIPGYTASSNGTLTSPNVASAPAPYIGPNPPAENPAFPHRYVELLYREPANFQVPASEANAIQTRRGFNMTTFVQATNLSTPIEANFFQVVNNSLSTGSPTGTGAHSSGTAHATGSSTARPPTFTGAGNTVATGSTFGAIVVAGVAMFL